MMTDTVNLNDSFLVRNISFVWMSSTFSFVQTFSKLVEQSNGVKYDVIKQINFKSIKVSIFRTGKKASILSIRS